jgi:hypothetical protein
MTEEVWNQLKDEKDAFGYSFKEAILSGCQNTDSGIGVYAGSPDSYAKFSPLFTPLLEHYHKFKLTTGHQSDMDASHLKCPPFDPEDAKMIKSTRIRVGRNLAEFPLGPGISKAQRDQVEQKVVEACSKFQGELQGKYYSLATMTPED